MSATLPNAVRHGRTRGLRALLAAGRIVAGFLFACHGAQKVLGLFGGVDEQGGRRRYYP